MIPGLAGMVSGSCGLAGLVSCSGCGNKLRGNPEAKTGFACRFRERPAALN